MLLLGIIVGMLVLLLIYWAYATETLPLLVFLSVIGGGILSCNQSEWYQASERASAAERAATDKAEATPHVIREADGCKVYAFKSGGLFHYFTRCPEGTTTEGHHTETTGSGKNARTKDVSETITVSTVHKEK